ncbi:recombinase family protein [Tumebacillus permanentifrigoris]|uniref:Site-specific DNA recombinase n=1 Tax=Tumebacillus permanentifrigoris TaxID=378543 RepID=A0A316D6J2_9BACL|nr:recombinase family protein [Tumebacillus permanentifrigoris]PWK10214.1 site-specific DNA recombinase [Tumebacillus permanentifrigoris]
MSTSVNVAIYIRVSTEEQAKEGFSLAAQKERLSQFANGLGWTIFDFYLDEGISAKDTNRPELQRMLKDMKGFRKQNPESEFVVLVFRLDRLTRSILDLFKLLELFEQHKVGFKSATEIFDTTTAIGRLFITIIGALAQWERENLAERVRVGMEQMVIEGKFHGGVAPFGYGMGKDGKLEIKEEEASTVKIIFDRYLKGMGDDNLCRWLNQMGYKTKKSGSIWHGSTVRQILQNPIYIGSLRWNMTTNAQYFEVENAAPAIISTEIFEQAQELRSSRTGDHPRTVNSDYLFTGRLICNRCGSPLSGTSSSFKGKKFKYYKCRGSLNGTCDLPTLNEDIMENCFLEYVRSLDITSAASEVAASKDAVEIDKNQEELQKLKSELEKVKSRKRKWQELYMDELITKDDLRKNTQQELDKEQELLRQISDLEGVTNQSRKSPEEIAVALQNFEMMWHLLAPAEKKSALGLLIDKMHVDTPITQHKKMRRQIDILNVSFR